MAAVAFRGTTYPVVLPKLRDPRLHLAATITSLQVLGQVAFSFRLSIAQILVALGTAGLIEFAITIRKQRALMWPASALLTGNGVAFVLRVPGTEHGDWWSLRGWWLFAAVSGGSLLSKHVLQWRGEHFFNPSNIGLVVCFLALGRGRADPLDFWWGPMSWWMALALAIIVGGGFMILSRLQLLRVALSFWAAFAAAMGVVALAGHEMTARWHLGPIGGLHLWWVLVTSPEVLVFLFFMITDPKTAPSGPRARLVYGVALGLLAGALIAPTTSEFAAKVALLASLAIVCVAMPLLRLVPRRALVLVAAPGLAAAAGVMVFGNGTAPSYAAQPLPAGRLPQIEIQPSQGVQTALDERTAEQIAYGLEASEPAGPGDVVQIHLEAGTDQGPPTAVAELRGASYRLGLGRDGRWTIAHAPAPQRLVAVRRSPALRSLHLTDVAPSIGLDFRQGSFRFGVSNDYRAMMGGGVCWLDYNGDGWEDLFVVNSYASSDTLRWEEHGGLPRTALFENVHGRFLDVSHAMHADVPVQGDGCVAADLNGDGRPDLLVTTTSGIDLLWNEGDRFVEGARAAGMRASGWYTGAAVADVNGDGRPDVFVAGYADPNEPVPGSIAGFPTNLEGVRDLLYLNEGGGRFREVGVQAGLEAADFRHGLGAMFLDYNGDGRPDLYVANDEDPNQLYENVAWPGGAKADPAGLGFRFEERGAAEGVADPFAGMGIAAAPTHSGLLDLFVSNSRREPAAAFSLLSGPRTPAFANARQAFDPALGTGTAGWGASFVDLANSGTPDLVLATGAIPVTNLVRDAGPVRVLGPDGTGFGDATRVLGRGLRVNGRGLAAADAGNDGRMDVAVNTIGGRLALLRASGPVGHWLDVRLSRFAPGAVVTAVLPEGRTLTRTVQAGSSYLSSEDPRVHLGLGTATRVAELTVRYPWGGVSRLADVRADRVVDVAAPPTRRPSDRLASRPQLPGCTPALHGRSIARFWDDTAVDVLRAGDAPEPVQARDLYDASRVAASAWAASRTQAARREAISFAVFRLLLWRASFGSNLQRTFGLLEARLRSVCYRPDFAATAGGSPAAVGNRLAAAAIEAGRHDGALEAEHYVDTNFTPQNAPLVVAEPGSAVHDATFWQPLALGEISPQGLGAVPAEVQSFVGAQWGRLAGFGLRASAKGLPIDPGPPPLGDPSDAAYKDAAVAAIRASSRPPAGQAPDGSPSGWNTFAGSLPAPSGTAARLRYDVRLDLDLNGALENAAIAAYGAKRAYDSPRPISMIRYLAFQGQSSDPGGPSYSPDGLPLVPGLVELVTKGSSAPGQRHHALAADVGRVAVLLRGRWVLGASWTPPEATPPSPGWVSARSAFAYAANEVLRALTGHSAAGRAAAVAASGPAGGIEMPADARAGRTLGEAAGKRALAALRALR